MRNGVFVLLRLAHIGFLVIVLVTCGCGESMPPLEPPVPGQRDMGSTLAELPFARDTEPEVAPGTRVTVRSDLFERALVFNVPRDGVLHFQEWELDFREEGLDPQRVDSALAMALEDYSEHYRATDDRRVGLVLNFDRYVTSRELIRQLAVLSKSACTPRGLEILCWSPVRRWPRRISFEFVPRPTSAVPLRLEHAVGGPVTLRRDDAGRAPPVTVPVIPDRPSEMGLPEVPPALAALLEASGPAVSLRLLTDDEDGPLFESVVYVLDAARAAGVMDVHLVDSGFTLRMHEHVVDPPWDPSPTPPLRKLGVMAIVALCFVAGLIAWRGRRAVGR